MSADTKKTLFSHYRKSLEVAGVTTSLENSLICPLCWQETPYDQLTLEHIVPQSIGGTRRILTCRRCNNDHGRDLDAHLSQYQTIVDTFQGHGHLQTKLEVNGNKLSANLQWGGPSKTFKVVAKASNPAASDAIQRDFAAGRVSEVNFTLFLRYCKNNFQTAVLRAAYLILFKCFGYEYARHEVVQVIRRRIVDPSLQHPRIQSLIVEARDFRTPYDWQHYVVPGNVNGVQFFLVIIRVRKATTTYLGAYLPVPSGRCDEFFDLMERCAKDHDGETLAFPAEAMFQ